ncbi:MAG: phosphohydrolase, partial [Treponema sp.]|nr:phosphohydrolase [Treponema sp.]
KNRPRYEETLAKTFRDAGDPISPGALIIDITEPVSFETGLFVQDENCIFAESSGAFGPGTVQSFVKSLHTIRIFVESPHEEAIKSLPGLNDILHIEKK